ncbi:hypothetical protein E4T43_02517 [Aureobasidium subglaciale]|nr:hypothetical protein E4T43_02517 [Aureobasidium subglaciale]
MSTSSMASDTTSSTSATPTNPVGTRSCNQIAASGNTFTDGNNVTYAVICTKGNMLLLARDLSPRADGDLGTVQSGSFEGCAPYCDSNSQCNSYSYTSSNGTCYLSSSSTVTQPIAGRDYAYKVQRQTSSSSSSTVSSTSSTSSTISSSSSSTTSSTSSSSTSDFVPDGYSISKTTICQTPTGAAYLFHVFFYKLSLFCKLELLFVFAHHDDSSGDLDAAGQHNYPGDYNNATNNHHASYDYDTGNHNDTSHNHNADNNHHASYNHDPSDNDHASYDYDPSNHDNTRNDNDSANNNYASNHRDANYDHNCISSRNSDASQDSGPYGASQERVAISPECQNRRLDATFVSDEPSSTGVVRSTIRSTLRVTRTVAQPITTAEVVTVTSDVLVPTGTSTVTAPASTVIMEVDKTVTTGVSTVTAPGSTIVMEVDKTTVTTNDEAQTSVFTVTSDVTTISPFSSPTSFVTLRRRDEEQKVEKEEKAAVKKKDQKPFYKQAGRPWFAFDGMTEMWM